MADLASPRVQGVPAARRPRTVPIGTVSSPALAEALEWLTLPVAAERPPPDVSTLVAVHVAAPPETPVGAGAAPPLVDFGEVDPLGAVTFRVPRGWWRSVELHACWTEWSPVPLHQEGREQTVTFALDDGEYAYGYLLDGVPAPDPLRQDIIRLSRESSSTPLVLRRCRHALLLRNPDRHPATFQAAAALPEWLRIEPGERRLPPRGTGRVEMRLVPDALPRSGEIHEVVCGQVCSSRGGVRPVRVQVHALVRYSAPVLNPKRVSLARQDGSVLLVVSGESFGAGALEVRVRALSSLKLLGMLRVTVTGDGDPFEVRIPLQGASGSAELLLDTGSVVQNRRFFRLKLSLPKG